MVMIKKICCFQLHSFALILGWIGAVFSGLLFLLGLISLMNSEAIVGSNVNSRFAVEMAIGASTFIIMISGLTSVGLIYGVLKENHKYLLPWIFHEAIACGLQVIVWVAGLVVTSILGYNYLTYGDVQTYEVTNDNDLNDFYANTETHVIHRHYEMLAPLIPLTIIGGIYLAIRIYIFIGIYSLFKNYRNGKLQDYEMLLENNGSPNR
ncbi:hypothetical protein ACFFRR_003793 [Megaselia abdita]